jgi:nicotinate-nucleotide pyrophosphorylase (carboxylating)
MSFTPEEEAACRRLVELALDEDLDARSDVTSEAIIPSDLTGQAVFRARTAGVVAGLPAVDIVFAALDPNLRFQALVRDGDRVKPGEVIARVRGPVRCLLAGERIALNFLQHLSGVATRTRSYVDKIGNSSCQILDTRKTLPGWRLLEKYAVRCGGGHNHRMGLFDAVLIKDNHLATLDGRQDAITRAITAARERFGSSIRITIEVDSFDQLDEALRSHPDVILLDNMDAGRMREAVQRRAELAPGVLLEASGGVSLSTVAEIAATGVNRISIGDLTHSAPALDIALDYENQ